MQIKGHFAKQLFWTILKLKYHKRQKNEKERKGLGDVLD